jgi:F-type H+-transporting ATPase subunit delta
LDEASGRVRATVTSAMELDKAQLERLSGTLKKIVKREVDLDVSIDPTLIGGLIAEVEGMIYDGSVKTQIMRLKQSLKGEI